MSESSDVGNNGPGQIIASSRPIRMAIFVVSNFLIAACAVFSVVRDQMMASLTSIFQLIENISDKLRTNYKSQYYINKLYKSAHVHLSTRTISTD